MIVVVISTCMLFIFSIESPASTGELGKVVRGVLAHHSLKRNMNHGARYFFPLH